MRRILVTAIAATIALVIMGLYVWLMPWPHGDGGELALIGTGLCLTMLWCAVVGAVVVLKLVEKDK